LQGVAGPAGFHGGARPLCRRRELRLAQYGFADKSGRPASAAGIVPLARPGAAFAGRVILPPSFYSGNHLILRRRPQKAGGHFNLTGQLWLSFLCIAHLYAAHNLLCLYLALIICQFPPAQMEWRSVISAAGAV